MTAHEIGRTLVCGLLIGVLATGGAVGCATMPPTGVPATGEPLRILERRVDDSGYRDVEVGTSEHYNSNGEHTGTSVQHQNQFVVASHLIWRLQQGAALIDAQDFMRIAGDAEGARDLEASRQRAVWLNRAGFPLAVAGVALALIGTRSLGTEDKAAATRGRYMYSGGAVLLGAGGLMIWFGNHKARPLTVLSEKNDDEMEVKRRLDDDLSRAPTRPAAPVPSPPVSTLPPPPPPSAAGPSTAPPTPASSPSVVAARYATGSITVAPLRLVDGDGRMLAEAHEDGTLWIGPQATKLGEIHGGAIIVGPQRDTFALARDGAVYAIRDSQTPERLGNLERDGSFRDNTAGVSQVLKTGRIKRLKHGETTMLRAHFAGPVPPRAQVLAVLVAAMFAKS